VGLAALPFGQTNIAAGLAAVNSQTGKFEAIRTTSMMVHGPTFFSMTARPGLPEATEQSIHRIRIRCRVRVSAASYGGTVRTPQSISTRDSQYYTQLWHDFMSRIRAGQEPTWVRTT
jgi:hypothetical protein